jgi:hypothetical protein
VRVLQIDLDGAELRAVASGSASFVNMPAPISVPARYLRRSGVR